MSTFLVILDVLPFEATINRVKNTRERERCIYRFVCTTFLTNVKPGK